jgi:predicted ester cyclase
VACSEGQPPGNSHLKAAVVAMVERGWNRGEVQVFASTIADSVRFHYAGRPRIVSREEMGAIVVRWREAFPDLRMEVHELVAESDLVAARLSLSGTHQGTWAGAAPTGRHVTMALMMLFRFENGKLVELWESDDQLGFRQQLGIVP